MRNLCLLCAFGAFLCFVACSPKVRTSASKSYQPLDYTQEVVVIDVGQTMPDGAELLGEVKVGDSGFSTGCKYDAVVDKAKLEARKMGGNAIKITEHKAPDLWSSCHRITANVLKIDDLENLVLEKRTDSLLDVDYAIIHVYRYPGPGMVVSYDLYLGDSVICRVKNNYKTTVHVTQYGLDTLWAKTESKAAISIDLERGRSYYVRCGLGMGVFVGHPELILKDSETGKREFESFEAKNQ